MKIFDSRKNIVMASIGVLFATLILVSCEKREEPLLNFDNTQTVFSKTVAFSARTGVQTRAFSDEKKRLNSGVLRNETSADTLCLTVFESDLSLSDDFVTRASEITDFTDNNFKVIAYTVGSEDNSTDITLGFSTEETTDNNFIKTVVNRRTVNTNGTETTIWEPEHNYYWGNIPAGKSLQFFAYDNIDDDNVKTTQNAFPTIEYTVNTRAEEQKDVLIAQSAKYSNATETSAALTFEHLLTAVQFEVDIKDEGQSYGTIKELSINGIYMSGVYNFATKKWDFGENPKGESTIDNTFTITNTSTDGKFSNDESSFMVIPQLLEEGTTISITFDDGDAKPLTCPLKGTWVAGKRYIYRISVTEYGQLDFTENTSIIQDAHYTICPIEFTYRGVGTIEWKLESNNTDKVVRYITSSEYNTNEHAQEGYWIAGTIDDEGNTTEYDKVTSITGTIQSGEKITVYAYFNENSTRDVVNVEFTLSCTINNTDIEPVKRTITQLCPTWNGTGADAIGCERIEDSYVEWGPYWVDANGDPLTEVKATSTVWTGGDFWDTIAKTFRLTLYMWFYGNDAQASGVKFNTINLLIIRPAIGVEINYSSYLNLDDEARNEDGLVNSKNLVTEQNIEVALDMEDWLDENGFTINRNYEPKKFDDTAILSSARKNKYYLNIQEGEGQTLEIPVLRDEDFVWYCPSLEECRDKKVIKNNPSPHKQENSIEQGAVFWTSTATSGSVLESVGFSISNPATGEGSSVDLFRGEKQRVRAVRKMSTTTTN